MTTISQVIARKGADLWSVTPEQTVFEAIELMAIRKIGALLVMDQGKLAGIVSERDYAREVILKGRSSRSTPVRDIMTAELVTITADTQVDAALSLMTERRVRHLPIVENGKVQGVVSIGDLVKEIITAQQSTIEHLESYIRG